MSIKTINQVMTTAPIAAGKLTWGSDLNFRPQVRQGDTGNVISLQMMGYGTYAARPAASSSNLGMHYLATDIGIAPGCEFRSTGTAWEQVGVCVLNRNLANVALATSTMSIFQTAPSLPNDCIGVGTRFAWGAKVKTTGGANSWWDVNTLVYIGATLIGSTGVLAAAFRTNAANLDSESTEGDIVCRTIGDAGSFMVSGIFDGLLNQYSQPQQIVDAAAAVDTSAAAISPNVKWALTGAVNAPAGTITSAWMTVTGLV